MRGRGGGVSSWCGSPFWSGGRPEARGAGLSPPPPAPPATERSDGLTRLTHGVAAVVVVGGIGLAMFVLNDFWLLLATQAVIYGVIFLSITVITGMGGQVSLCQGAFAAVGAFTTAQLVDNLGLPVLTAPTVMGAQSPSRTVRQDCRVMRRITSVIARPMSGSAISRPMATTAALATTARLT